MWDHIMFGPAYEVNMDTLDRVLHDPVVLAKALTDYTIKAEGVLTSNVGEFLGWEKLPEKYRANFSQSTIDALNKFPDDWPEVEVSLGVFSPLPCPLTISPVHIRQRLHRHVQSAHSSTTSRWEAVRNHPRRNRSTFIPRERNHLIRFHI